MAEQFGVSRVPVREAPPQLEAEGLVSSELHRGAFVSSRTPEEIEEMLDIRLALEVRALTLALPNITPRVVAKARKLLAAYDRSEDPQAWRDLNIAFRMTLYAPCNRPRMLKMVEDVVLCYFTRPGTKERIDQRFLGAGGKQPDTQLARARHPLRGVRLPHLELLSGQRSLTSD